MALFNLKKLRPFQQDNYEIGKEGEQHEQLTMDSIISACVNLDTRYRFSGSRSRCIWIFSSRQSCGREG
jgi:hypothetical protein